MNATSGGVPPARMLMYLGRISFAVNTCASTLTGVPFAAHRSSTVPIATPNPAGGAQQCVNVNVVGPTVARGAAPAVFPEPAPAHAASTPPPTAPAIAITPIPPKYS